MSLAIDRDRLIGEIEALALISDAEPPVVTRIVFTPSDLKSARMDEGSMSRKLAFPCARMRSEIPSRAGMVRIRLRRLSALARTSTQFRTLENTTAWWECWEGWKRFGHCSRADFVRGIRSSC